MRILRWVLLGVALTPATASWFASDQPSLPYTSWSTAELTKWLQERNIPVPAAPPSYQDQLLALVADNWNSAAAWTQEQYDSARQSVQNLRESSFDAWDESRLRQFLLERGVVSPHSTREHLALIAKSKYKESLQMLQEYEERIRDALPDNPLRSQPSRVSEAIAQATLPIGRKIDDSRDYVYSSWDNNRLRAYLQDRGLLKTETEVSRHDLLGMMKHAYASVANPVWDAWSTSYIHEWLVNHGLAKSEYEKNRDELIKLMHSYYYDVNDRVWNSWSDGELHSWLVNHGIIKSSAQLNREKMMKLLSDNYLRAQDTLWAAWSDSQLRNWLIENGHIRSDTQLKRDELVKLADDKYTDAAERMANYLIWPDARLRAFLRERGINEGKLPTSRSGLLQEVRVRYVQTEPKVIGAFRHIFDLAAQSVTALGRAFGIVATRAGDYYDATSSKVDGASQHAHEKVQEAKRQASGEAARAYDRAQAGRDYAYEQARGGANTARENVQRQGQRAEDAAREASLSGRETVQQTSKVAKGEAGARSASEL
ncbi:hypothetical protein AX16_001978 [Volvariella volvacea WC 439]|nr:hypothetical protein AX16_001978 [Volvariella volvacea WC 439]